jgi:hypothetical protein
VTLHSFFQLPFKPFVPGRDLERWDFDALGARLRRLLGLLRDNRRVIDANGLDAIHRSLRPGDTGRRLRLVPLPGIEAAAIPRPGQLPKTEGDASERGIL